MSYVHCPMIRENGRSPLDLEQSATAVISEIAQLTGFQNDQATLIFFVEHLCRDCDSNGRSISVWMGFRSLPELPCFDGRYFACYGSMGIVQRWAQVVILLLHTFWHPRWSMVVCRRDTHANILGN